MQGKQRHLQGEADREEAERRLHRARVHHGRQAVGQVRHVQRARHPVHQADADEDEGGAGGAHDEVAEGGQQRARPLRDGDQGVRGERGDLQEHEDVEGIARDGDAEQAGEAEQPRRVEEHRAVLGDLLRHAVAGEQQHQRARPRDDQQDQGVHGVDVLDAPGSRPAAELVGDAAAVHHLRQQQRRDEEGRPARRRGQPPGSLAAPEQDARRRRHQRQDHLQRRQVREDGAQASPSRSSRTISSSSMLP